LIWALSLMVVLQSWMTVAAGRLPPDEIPIARSYHRWLLSRVQGLERQLPAVRQAADAAAARLLAGGQLAVLGGPGLSAELQGQGGSFMAIGTFAPGRGDVTLFGLTADHLDADLARCADLRRAGCFVVAIGSRAQLRQAGLEARLAEAVDVLLDHGGPAVEGEFDPSLAMRAPTSPVLNAVMGWTFLAELWSQCVRGGRVPVLQRHATEPGCDRWRRAHDGQMFHAAWSALTLPESGLGGAYLRELGAVLEDVGTASWRSVAKATWRATAARRQGGVAWLRAGTRWLSHHHAGQLAADPRGLVALDHDGSDPSQPAPGRGDFVVAIGDAEPPGSGAWGEPELFRRAGRGVAWVTGAALVRRSELWRGEIHIDPRWPASGGLLRVAGYPVALGSASGVVSEAILWMISVEVAHAAGPAQAPPAPPVPAAPPAPPPAELPANFAWNR
jgi:hypothetical protein